MLVVFLAVAWYACTVLWRHHYVLCIAGRTYWFAPVDLGYNWNIMSIEHDICCMQKIQHVTFFTFERQMFTIWSSSGRLNDRCLVNNPKIFAKMHLIFVFFAFTHIKDPWDRDLRCSQLVCSKVDSLFRGFILPLGGPPGSAQWTSAQHLPPFTSWEVCCEVGRWWKTARLTFT